MQCDTIVFVVHALVYRVIVSSSCNTLCGVALTRTGCWEKVEDNNLLLKFAWIDGRIDRFDSWLWFFFSFLGYIRGTFFILDFLVICIIVIIFILSFQGLGA